MEEGLPDLVSKVAKAFGNNETFSVNAAQVINNKKVSDHHAIIPIQSTVNADLQELPAGERAVLQLIAVRLLVAVSKSYCYAETILELTCANAVFTAKGKAVREEGWKGIEAIFRPERKSKEEKEVKNLPVVSNGDTLNFENVEIKEGKTSPSKRLCFRTCGRFRRQRQPEWNR